MMRRREFFSRFGILGALFAVPKWASAFKQDQKTPSLVILHTNDTHSQIDPLPANHSKYPNQGGIAARATMIEKYRQSNDHVLLLDSGDFFQGTPYFNRFHGVLEMKLMSALGYDIVTLGNHDFDIGIEGFMKAQQYANFSFVNANYDFGSTPLQQIVKPFQIIEKGPFKIGVFGIGINLNGLVAAPNFEGLFFKDPYESAQETVATLQKKNCDLIICLSHLGYDYPDKSKPSDVNLAQKVSGIDLILGGHTHTFMEAPEKVQNPLGKEVWIHQVGWAGVRLGVIEVSKQKMKFLQKTIR